MLPLVTQGSAVETLLHDGIWPLLEYVAKDDLEYDRGADGAASTAARALADEAMGERLVESAGVSCRGDEARHAAVPTHDGPNELRIELIEVRPPPSLSVCRDEQVGDVPTSTEHLSARIGHTI